MIGIVIVIVIVIVQLPAAASCYLLGGFAPEGLRGCLMWRARRGW